MEWLIAIICIILVVAFWRIFVPLALIVVVGIWLLVGKEDQGGGHGRHRELIKQKIENARTARLEDMVREWDVSFTTDPASGEEIPRHASILSDDGLCRLQVEERLNGVELTSINCPQLKVAAHQDIEVKFDNRPTSDTMDIQRFSNSDAVYIPSHQSAHHLSYDEFLKRMAGANKVALRLTFEQADHYWFTFSLRGSGPALTAIGAVLPE